MKIYVERNKMFRKKETVFCHDKILFSILCVLFVLFFCVLGITRYKKYKNSVLETTSISTNDFVAAADNVEIDKYGIHFSAGNMGLAYVPLSLNKGDGIQILLSGVKTESGNTNAITIDLCSENYDKDENQISYSVYGSAGEVVTINGRIFYGNTHPDDVNLRIITDGGYGLNVQHVEIDYINYDRNFGSGTLYCLLSFCLVFLIYIYNRFCVFKIENNYSIQVRNRSFDITKFFAMVFVAWSHFVSVGTNATTIQGVIGLGEFNGSTLLPQAEHKLWLVDAWLYNNFGIEPAIVGVVLFFLVSGFFVPEMQERYNEQDKEGVLIHCLKKIWPIMIVCILFDGALSYLSSGIVYSFKQYFTTALGISLPLGVVATCGVIWYMEVLLFVYLLATLIRRFSVENITLLYILQLLLIVTSSIVKDCNYGWILRNMAYILHFSGICFVGIVARLSKDKKWYIRLSYIGLSLFLTIFNINIYQSLYGEIGGYGNVYTYAVATGVMVLSFCLSKLLKKKHKNVVEFFLDSIRRLFLPFYLLHVNYGITAMWIAREYKLNPYMAVSVAFVFSFGVSAILYRFMKTVLGQTIKIRPQIIRSGAKVEDCCR